MPKQGQSVESCIVSEFKVKVGDAVKPGDILFGYETDKATFEEESKFEGTVLAIFWKDGDEIPCLENVLVIGQPGESFEEFKPKGDTAPAAEGTSSETVSASPETAKAEAAAQPVDLKTDSAESPEPLGLNSSKDSPGAPMTRTFSRQGISSPSFQKMARTVPSNVDSSSKVALSVS